MSIADAIIGAALVLAVSAAMGFVIVALIGDDDAEG